MKPRKRKPKKQVVDSETSEFEMTDNSSESDLCEFMEEQEEISLPEATEVGKGDWVIIKFCGKRNIRRFVGLVLEYTSEEVSVKFSKRIDDKRFKWPDNDDISAIDYEQIKALNPPEFSYQNDRVISFVFKHKFTSDVE